MHPRNHRSPDPDMKPAEISAAIPCWALTFSIKELEAVREMLSQEGYNPDVDGLKDWIMDTVNEEPREEHDPVNAVIGGLAHHLSKHPEILQAGMTAGKNILAGMMRNKKRAH